MEAEHDDDRDSLDMTPQEIIAKAKAQLEQYAQEAQGAGMGLPDKCLVIFLWDDQPGQYATSFWNAGLSVSQLIGLCEIQKMRFHRMMDGPREEE